MESTEAFAQLEAAQFLDVRTDHEYDAGHIEGALHIPLHDLPARYEELDPARPVIVTCQIGQRSGIAAEFLRARRFDAHNLEGGLESWVRGGLPLVGAEGSPGDVVDGRAEYLE